MLLLVRHGQASFGSTHYDRLSPLGQEQARITGDYLRPREASIEYVVVGPRERHRDTATGILSTWTKSIAMRHEADLDEFTGGGNLMNAVDSVTAAIGQGATVTERNPTRLLDRIGAWAQGELTLPGSPTLVEFRVRVGHWLQRELQGDTGSSFKVAVTSGGVIAAAVLEVMSLPNNMFLPIVSQVRNASLTEFSLLQGRPVLYSFNGTHHLPGHLGSWI